MTKWKPHKPKCKVRVALEAMKSEQTVGGLAAGSMSTRR